MGTKLDVGEHSVGNRRRHVLFVRVRTFAFSGVLRNGEGEGNFYSPGGVPWQWRTPLWEAKSLLWRNSPSIRQGIAIGTEFLCDK